MRVGSRSHVSCLDFAVALPLGWLGGGNSAASSTICRCGGASVPAGAEVAAGAPAPGAAARAHLGGAVVLEGGQQYPSTFHAMFAVQHRRCAGAATSFALQAVIVGKHAWGGGPALQCHRRRTLA